MFIDKELKDVTVNFKVTKSQKKVLDQMAEERGLKLTEMILTLLDNEFNEPKLTKNQSQNQNRDEEIRGKF